MPSYPASAEPGSVLEDRQRLGRTLQIIGIVGVIASLLVGVIGWIAADRVFKSVATTLDPVSRIVINVSESIDATEVIFSQTIDAVNAIETTTRSGVRALDSVSEVLGETGELAGGGVADSLDTAVETLDGLTSTARIIDRTMSALSFVGVDYDPPVPLDQSLADLQASLEPIPGQVRDQVELFETVETDLDQIAEDGRRLSAILLDTRIEMNEAKTVLASASANANAAAENVELIRTDIETFDALSGVAVIAATIALLAAAATPLLVGTYFRRWA